MSEKSHLKYDENGFPLKFTAHYCIRGPPLDLCPADPTADMEKYKGDEDDRLGKMADHCISGSISTVENCSM